LRSAVLDSAWYQYFLLDVIAVLALVAVCLLVAMYCMTRAVTSIVCQYATNDKKCKEECMESCGLVDNFTTHDCEKQ